MFREYDDGSLGMGARNRMLGMLLEGCPMSASPIISVPL